MHAAKWIPIPRDGIAPDVHPADALWALESPSPFDVPSHLRARYDDQTGCIHIEFQYLNDEPTVTEVLPTAHPHLSLEVGKGTRRVWKISINARAYGRDKNQIVAAAQNSLRPSRVSNTLIAERALARRGSRALDLAFAH